MRKKIHVNEKKGRVTTIILDKGVTYVGMAKCQPGDNFDIETGKKISLLKAKKKVFKGRNALYRYYINWYERTIGGYKKLVKDGEDKIAAINKELEQYK